MEEAKKPNVKLWCFWISVAVVFLVFILPVETKSYESGSVTTEFRYTIWDKIVGNGPKEKGRMYIDGKEWKR